MSKGKKNEKFGVKHIKNITNTRGNLRVLKQKVLVLVSHLRLDHEKKNNQSEVKHVKSISNFIGNSRVIEQIVVN